MSSLNIFSKKRKEVQPVENIRTQQQVSEIKFRHSNKVYLIGKGFGNIVKTVITSYEANLNDTVLIPLNEEGMPINKNFFLENKKQKKSLKIGDILASRSPGSMMFSGYHRYEIIGLTNNLLTIGLVYLNRIVTLPENDIVKIIAYKQGKSIKLIYEFKEDKYKLLNLNYENQSTYNTDEENETIKNLLKQLSNIIKNGKFEELITESKSLSLNDDDKSKLILPVYYFINKKNYLVSDVNLNGYYGTLIKTQTGNFLITSHTMTLKTKRKDMELYNNNRAKLLTGDYKDYIVIYKEIPQHYSIYFDKMKKTMDKIYENETESRNIIDNDLFFLDIVLDNNNYFEVRRITPSGNFEGREIDTTGGKNIITFKTILDTDIKELNTDFKIFKQPGVRIIYKKQDGKTKQLEEMEEEEEYITKDETQIVDSEEPIETEEEGILDTEGEYPFEEEREEEQEEIEAEDFSEKESEEPQFLEPEQMQSTFKDIERIGFARKKFTEKQKEYLSRINSILRIFSINQTVFEDPYTVILEIENWVNKINKKYKELMNNEIEKQKSQGILVNETIEEITNKDEKYIIANVLFNKFRKSYYWTSIYSTDINFYKKRLIAGSFFTASDIELDITSYLKPNFPYELDINRINNLLKQGNSEEIIEIMFDNCRQFMASIEPSEEFLDIISKKPGISEQVGKNIEYLVQYVQKIMNIYKREINKNELQNIVNIIQELLYKINLFLRTKNMVISNNDAKYIVAIYLMDSFPEIDSKQYLETLIENKFITPSDFRIRSSLFLMDIADALTEQEKQEMESSIRSYAKIPDYKNILGIMFSNAQNLYEKIQMRSSEELKSEIDIFKPVPIIGKRKLETRILLGEEKNTISDIDYIVTRQIPDGVNKIRWSKTNMYLIYKYTEMLRSKMNEEKSKTDTIRQFVSSYVNSEFDLENLIKTAKILYENKELENQNIDIALYKKLNTSKLNIYNLITICETLLDKIKNISTPDIRKELDKLIDEKKETIQYMYSYIIKNIYNAPFAIKNLEILIEELKEKILETTDLSERNELVIAYNSQNILLSHFKNIFNILIDILGNEEAVKKEKGKFEQEKRERQEKLEKMDLRAKFPIAEDTEQRRKTKLMFLSKEQSQKEEERRAEAIKLRQNILKSGQQLEPEIKIERKLQELPTESIEMSEMPVIKEYRKKQKVGLSKEARSYIPKQKEIRKDIEEERKRIDEERDEVDLEDVENLKRMMESEELSEEERTLINKLSGDLETKMSMNDYVGVLNEMKRLGLK